MNIILIIIISGMTIWIWSSCKNKDKDKDPVPNIIMTKDQEWIVNRLRKADISEFDNNLWNNVCPLCRKTMNLHTYGSFDQFSDHWCNHCGFITKMEVLT